MTRLRGLRSLRRGRLQLIALIVAAALLAPRPAHLETLLAQSATGRVTGTVKLTMANSAPSAATAYERRSVGPRPKPQPELRNVVVFFADLRATKVAPMQASIAQRDEQFVPHVVAVTAGSSVAFPNEDPFFHNVFSLSRGASFNLGRYPSGASRSRVVARPGIIKVFCEIHSHMSAVARVRSSVVHVPSYEGTFPSITCRRATTLSRRGTSALGAARSSHLRAGATTGITFTLPVGSRHEAPTLLTRALVTRSSPSQSCWARSSRLSLRSVNQVRRVSDNLGPLSRCSRASKRAGSATSARRSRRSPEPDLEGRARYVVNGGRRPTSNPARVARTVQREADKIAAACRRIVLATPTASPHRRQRRATGGGVAARRGHR